MRVKRLLVAALMAAPLVALPMAAAPETPAPIATEELGGTILSVTPHIAYESALLRISGPNGYTLAKQIAAGTPITADLLAEAALRAESPSDDVAAAWEARSFLPDGKYYYEVVITDSVGKRAVHTGMFYVEHGSLVSRDAKRAEFAAIRNELASTGARVTGDSTVVATSDGAASEPGSESLTENNWIWIQDGAVARHDGSLYIGPSAFTDIVELFNLDGAARFTYWSSSGNPTYTMTILPNGNVGIGTTTPANDLHIAGSDVHVILESSSDSVTWAIEEDFGDFLIDLNATDGGTVGGKLRIDEDTGTIGIGHNPPDPPNAPLHVVGSAPTGPNTMTVQRNDATTPNIRFLKTNGADQSWLFQNNANSGVFAIRDETNGNSAFRLFPGVPEGALQLNANGSFNTSTGASLTAGGVWQNASSRTLKTAIEELSSAAALTALTDLKPVRFEYKKEPGDTKLGFIAEDVPELVASADRKGLSAMDISAVLTRVVQEQQHRLAEQERLITELTARIEQLEANN